MKVNFIPVSNYNRNNDKLNNNFSKQIFKGKNFAKSLKENYNNAKTKNKDKFDLFKGLMQEASKEKGFNIINKNVFNELQKVKSFDDLVSLLERWYQNKSQPTAIAEDYTRKPIIEYLVFYKHSNRPSCAIKELRFSSTDKDNCTQAVSFETVKLVDGTAHIFVDSNRYNNLYSISDTHIKK